MEASLALNPWAHKLPHEMQNLPQMDPKERFYRTFQSSVSEIQEQIAQLHTFSPVGGERQDATEAILAAIAHLSNEVADAAGFVPAYDLRSYSQTVKGLSDQLGETLAELAPRAPRFQFKSRKAGATAASGNGSASAGGNAAMANPKPDSRRLVGLGLEPPANVGREEEEAGTAKAENAVETKDYNQEIAQATGPGPRKPSFSSARDIVLSDHEGVHVVLPAGAARATSSGALTNLRRCVVDMSAPTMGEGGGGGGARGFASLALKNISNSVVVAGRVSGSVHVTGVRDSVVIVLARQVRMHECENVVFYLFCGSHPIIEDCKGVKVTPVPDCYLTENEDPTKNQWDQVDDFKWLKAERSPNWSVLPESERVADVVWKDSVSGNAGVGLDEILKAIGIGSGE